MTRKPSLARLAVGAAAFSAPLGALASTAHADPIIESGCTGTVTLDRAVPGVVTARGSATCNRPGTLVVTLYHRAAFSTLHNGQSKFIQLVSIPKSAGFTGGGSVSKGAVSGDYYYACASLSVGTRSCTPEQKV